jgi:DNA repair exonuclease SbcCD ATPase subunit
MMDTVTTATSEGIDEELQRHLAEKEAKPEATDTMPIPLNEAELARHTRLQALKDEIADLQERLSDIADRVTKAGEQATSAVKNGAKWADASAHDQLGAYPWAKLGGAMFATIIGTRLIRMLPLGGIASVAVPLVISQVKQQNQRRR